MTYDDPPTRESLPVCRAKQSLRGLCALVLLLGAAHGGCVLPLEASDEECACRAGTCGRVVTVACADAGPDADAMDADAAR